MMILPLVIKASQLKCVLHAANLIAIIFAELAIRVEVGFDMEASLGEAGFCEIYDVCFWGLYDNVIRVMLL